MFDMSTQSAGRIGIVFALRVEGVAEAAPKASCEGYRLARSSQKRSSIARVPSYSSPGFCSNKWEERALLDASWKSKSGLVYNLKQVRHL